MRVSDLLWIPSAPYSRAPVRFLLFPGKRIVLVKKHPCRNVSEVLLLWKSEFKKLSCLMIPWIHFLLRKMKFWRKSRDLKACLVCWKASQNASDKILSFPHFNHFSREKCFEQRTSHFNSSYYWLRRARFKFLEIYGMRGKKATDSD